METLHNRTHAAAAAADVAAAAVAAATAWAGRTVDISVEVEGRTHPDGCKGQRHPATGHRWPSETDRRRNHSSVRPSEGSSSGYCPSKDYYARDHPLEAYARSRKVLAIC